MVIGVLDYEDPEMQAAIKDLDIDLKPVKTLDEGFQSLKNNEIQSLVGGFNNTTGDFLKASFKYLKPRTRISGAMLMTGGSLDRPLVFSDCAVQPNPSVDELKDIGINACIFARNYFKSTVYCSYLSFSTNGSSQAPDAIKPREVAKMHKLGNKFNDVVIEGEVQADAALNEKISLKKNLNSLIKGNSNVLIFPDLNSGNISYKLVRYASNCSALGPFLLGYDRLLCDLSRGATSAEIKLTIQVLSELLTAESK